MLDRTLFSLSLQLVALRIPARKCSEFMTRLQGHLIHRPRVKPVTREPEGTATSRARVRLQRVTCHTARGCSRLESRPTARSWLLRR